MSWKETDNEPFPSSCDVLDPQHTSGTSSLAFKHLHQPQIPHQTPRSRKITQIIPPELKAGLCSCSGRGQEEFDGQTADGWTDLGIPERRLWESCFIFSRAAQRGASKNALMRSAAAPLHWHLINFDFIIPTGKLLFMVFVSFRTCSAPSLIFAVQNPAELSVSVSGSFLTYNYVWIIT